MSQKEEPKKMKLISLTCEEGAYCISEYEISHDMFLKHCKKVFRSEPERFDIVAIQVIKKARELLEI